MLVEQSNNEYNNPFKYNGKELDEATRLYYYGARYYDPKTSIWLSVDPLAVYNPVMETEFYGDGQHNGGVYNSGNLNPYIYTYQNPIKYIDPNGKQTVAPGTYNTAFVYYVSGDVGHTSVGYYGKYDTNPGVLYAPLSGNAANRQSRKGSDGNWYSGVSEALTIKSYLDSGDKVERYHYKLRDEAMESLALSIESDLINPGNTFDQQYCTLQASQAIRMSYEGIKGVDPNKAAEKIIPYRFPSDLSNSEVLKTGSIKYDVFTKEKDKYYMTTHSWDPRNVGKDWFQKNILGMDGWSSTKKEIKFSK
ncbi:MAG: RHS repeat-associated core domain-containing protein [Bacteroidetes bacterium]|nr:RHS repeat-associated core domain-containing protein [Bacteroidota bacterium]